MVLGLEDDDGGVARQRPGQEVERVGRVAGEDDLVVLPRADEGGDLGAGCFIEGAADTRVPALAAVHAAVGRGRALHGVRDGQECWGGGAVVEVRDIEPLTKDGGHALLGADDRQDGAGVTQVDDWCGGHMLLPTGVDPRG